jgi:hypothetical protein
MLTSLIAPSPLIEYMPKPEWVTDLVRSSVQFWGTKKPFEHNIMVCDQLRSLVNGIAIKHCCLRLVLKHC